MATKQYVADRICAEAKKWLGVRENGFNKGKEVEMFQKAVDGHARGEPWCMAFVQYVAKTVFMDLSLKSSKPPGLLTANLYPSEHCMSVWNGTAGKYKNKTGGPGQIAIWKKRGKNPTGAGHTGFAMDSGTTYFNTVEGNTNQAGSREGDGVYTKKRLYVGGGMELKGFIDLPQMLFDLLPDDAKIT